MRDDIVSVLVCPVTMKSVGGCDGGEVECKSVSASDGLRVREGCGHLAIQGAVRTVSQRLEHRVLRKWLVTSFE